MSICIRSGRTNASRKALKMELAEPYFGQRHWITVESHFYTVMILIEIYVYSCEVLRCFCVKTKHRISELYDMITNHGGKKTIPVSDGHFFVSYTRAKCSKSETKHPLITKPDHLKITRGQK